MPGPKGAPLLRSEIEEIERAFPVIKKYLDEDHLHAIETQGLVDRSSGGATTTCFDNRACVFVTYELGIAKCAFEKAYWNKEIAWRKPISCHLFPIRVDHGFTTHVRYESIGECSAALRKGELENVSLSQFLKDALVRAFGDKWYGEFLEACSPAQKKPAKTADEQRR